MAPSCCIAATVESGRKKAGVEPRPVVRRRNPGRTPPPPCERREANGDGVPVSSIIIGALAMFAEVEPFAFAFFRNAPAGDRLGNSEGDGRTGRRPEDGDADRLALDQELCAENQIAK